MVRQFGEKGHKPRWKRVDVGDSLLAGATEGGFVELEELDARDFNLLSPEATDNSPTIDPEADKLTKRPRAGDDDGEPRKRQKRGGVPGGDGDSEFGPSPTVNFGVPAPDVAAGAAKKPKKQTAVKKEGVKQGESRTGEVEPREGMRDDAVGKTAKGTKKKKRKGKKARVSGADDEDGETEGETALVGGDDGSDVASLKVQLARLRAENAALKAHWNEINTAPKKDGQKSGKGKQAPKGAGQILPGVSTESGERVAEMLAWERFELDERLLGGLAGLGFESPTPIQEACLFPAIRERRDVIGAAQTGSGKTLAFGLPILQLLLMERQAGADVAQGADLAGGSGSAKESAGQGKTGSGGLRALIMTPTRELALQVCGHLEALAKGCGIWVVPVVGGLAAPKQERLLKRGPEVVVATPGRLWEVLRNNWPGINDVRRLSWLVLDEADRMVQQGHFQELTSILRYIDGERRKYGAGSLTNAGTGDADEDTDVPPDESPSAAAREIVAAAGDKADEDEHGAEGGERDGEGAEGGPGREGEERDGEGGESGQQMAVSPFIQTFVFSATLTLPEKLRARLARGGGGASGSGSFASLLDRIRFRGTPKVVDLTNSRRLADKVEEAVLYCSEAERDALLYYLLATHSGRTLVFVNAISAVRRVAALLKLLGLPAAPLHASMQQRQRLKALDRFRANDDAILVATDVAARGLDISGVRCVVHYQVAASADTYVHRSGRTARAHHDGLAVSLVAPKDSPRFAALLKAMGREEPPSFPVDPGLLPGAERRVRLAVRLDQQLRAQSKAGADASWRRRQAEVLELDLSDDGECDSDDKKGRQAKGKKSTNVSGLQQELSSLLAEPLQPSYSRKFFTGKPSAAAALGLARHPSAKGGNPSGGAETLGTDPPGALSASGVARNVVLANSLTAALQGAKLGPAARGKKGKKKSKAPGGFGTRPTDAEVLERVMRRRAMKKEGKRRMVVVPSALARNQQAGPDALTALRTSLQR